MLQKHLPSIWIQIQYMYPTRQPMMYENTFHSFNQSMNPSSVGSHCAICGRGIYQTSSTARAGHGGAGTIISHYYLFFKVSSCPFTSTLLPTSAYLSNYLLNDQSLICACSLTSLFIHPCHLTSHLSWFYDGLYKKAFLPSLGLPPSTISVKTFTPWCYPPYHRHY